MGSDFRRFATEREVCFCLFSTPFCFVYFFLSQGETGQFINLAEFSTLENWLIMILHPSHSYRSAQCFGMLT